MKAKVYDYTDDELLGALAALGYKINWQTQRPERRKETK